jgi:hypothetical protein
MKRTLPVILVLSTVLSAGALPQAGSRTTRPNILLILADDLGAESSALYPQLYNSGAASALGQVSTPTLSALAARGLVFDNVWATPLCSNPTPYHHSIIDSACVE